MNIYVKLALILFGLAYLISPVDIIPDILVPYLGWLDDGLVLWCVYYLLRYQQLPWFLFKKKPFPGQHQAGAARMRTSPGNQKRRDHTSRNPRETPRPKPKTPEPEYEILGVRPDATWKEIQTAYKDRIKKYHPDKLNHLGEEFSDLANEKFLEIQQAYERLKRKKYR